MFFLLGGGTYILIAAAVIPAIILVRYIYKLDRLEKEPSNLIRKAVLFGVISTYLAMVLELLGEKIMNGMLFKSEAAMYLFEFCVIVGPAEELAKYLAFRYAVWKDPAFNCQFDGIVYCVSAALGFALWENIKYVSAYGFGTALVRAVTAVPGHACFGVFMGIWAGVAKRQELIGHSLAAKLFMFIGWLSAALIHGLYDYLATVGSTTGGNLSFIGFIIVMFAICLFSVKTLSKKDRYIQ